MQQAMENLKYKSNRKSTDKIYLTVWREFNKFLIKLDKRPEHWEDRVALFATYLVEKGRKSATIRSYILAIKFVLKRDNYIWDRTRAQLNTLTKACKLINDTVKIRLPISSQLLDLILFEIERIYQKQPYLEILYKTMLIVGYHGLLRIGEMTSSPHQILAKNVHVGQNKKKIMLILFSSKTHTIGDKPQRIIITSNESDFESKRRRHFCPFQLIKLYIKFREPSYTTMDEPFFIYKDKGTIVAEQIRNMLRKALTNLNLNAKLYDCHSLRIGKSVEMRKNGAKLSEIQIAGRWRSNAVFKYLNN